MGKKYLGDSALRRLMSTVQAAINSKQNTLTGTPGNIVTFGADGKISELSRSILKGDKGDKGDTGPTGEKGSTGPKGADGVSVTSVEQIAASTADGGTNTFRITLSNGKTTDFSVKNGSKGSAGSAAGFGTPTATVDANVGTPSVVVTTSGTNTSKVFNFEFKNLKGQPGAAGTNGAKGATGTRGSRWSVGTAITGTSTTATIFSGSGITDALVNDMFLNSSTGNVYRCTTAGEASVAKWVYVACVKGPSGTNATTTAVASTSANGLMSSAMVTKLNGIEAGATKCTEMSDATIESIFNSVFG